MRLMDEGIVASCEADIGSAVTMMLAHNLLGLPGFMADPLVDTAQNLFANAHCNCPTQLDGFQQPPAEYILRSHHAGGHWVSPQVLWRAGRCSRSPASSGRTCCWWIGPRWSATTTAPLGHLHSEHRGDRRRRWGRSSQSRRVPGSADLRRPRAEAPRLLPALSYRGRAFVGPTRIVRFRAEFHMILPTVETPDLEQGFADISMLIGAEIEKALDNGAIKIEPLDRSQIGPGPSI